jgi:ketosteroid isomerase-like protein
MKKQFFGILVLLIGLIVSCAQPTEQALTEEERNAIEQEVRDINDGLASSANALKTDFFRDTYWNDDQFLAVDFYGVSGYDTYINDTEEMYSTMEAIEFTKDTVMVRVLDAETVYAIFKGRATGQSKNGAKMNLNNFYASMLLRKVNDEWKIAFTHESAEQEIMMPTDSTMVEEAME